MPYYQPVVNGSTGHIDGFEVLARWHHPRAGFIPPDAFIPVAKKSGLIIPLTRYLMRRVQSGLSSLLSQLADGLHIGINISAAHVKSGQLAGDCQAFLEGFSQKPQKLILEITEHSGLSYLNESVFDIIKIDKSFVSRITPASDSTRLVDCVIDMARRMSVSIVAEGVETRAQADYLTRQGIPLLQGYYYYRPMPFSELASVLAKRSHSQEP